MKHLSILFLLLCVVFALLPTATAQDDDTVTLVIWGEPGMVSCIEEPDSTWEFCNYVNLLNDRWHEKHPNIRLQWESHGWAEELEAELLTAIEEGNTPDITVGEAFMPQLARDGHLAPFDASEEVIANLIPATVAGVTVDDTVYGVAAFTAVFTLEINADVFLFSGLIPEAVDLSTWDGVAEAAATITEAGGGEFYGFSILGPTFLPAASLFRAAPYIYQTGAEFCNVPDCDTATFNDPLAIPAYEWFRELQQYTMPDLTFQGEEGYIFSQLFTGLTGMQTAGSWHPSWASGNGCEDCRYLPLPLPEDGVRTNVVVGNAMYSTLATSEHIEESNLFLEWLASDEVQETVFWTGVGGRLPTTFSSMQSLLDAMEGDVSSVPEFYTEALNKSIENAPAEAATYEVFIDELLNGDVRILPPWAEQGTALNALWNEMFAEVLISDRPIEDILDDYQARADELLSE